MTIARKQLRDFDCALACTGMVLGKDPTTIFDPAYYADVEEKRGTTMADSLKAAGLIENQDFWTVYVGSFPGAGNARQLLSGRRAVLQVPSLNNHRAMHFVFWDGKALHDPSNKQVYYWLDQCRPEHVIIFNELEGKS
jgi:hypothetical protein